MVFRAATQAYKQAIISEYDATTGHTDGTEAPPLGTEVVMLWMHWIIVDRHPSLGTLLPRINQPPPLPTHRSQPHAWLCYTDGTRAGMTAEGVAAASKSAKQMSLREAEMILGVEGNASWEDVMKKYKHLYEANDKNGSFYLLSKVYR